MYEITNTDLEYLRRLVTSSFRRSRAFRTDASLEIDDLVQEGILYLLSRNRIHLLHSLLQDKENVILRLQFKRGIQYYLRDVSGLVKTPRNTDTPEWVYPPLDTLEDETTTPIEEYYDDALLHTLLLDKCNTLLSPPDGEMVLLHFGLQGVLPSGLAYAALAEIFCMHRSAVGKRIQGAFYTLSKDAELKQAHAAIRGMNPWMY